MTDESPFVPFLPSTEAPSSGQPEASKPPKKPRKNAKKPAPGNFEIRRIVGLTSVVAPAKAPKKPRTKVVKKQRVMKVDPLLIFGACVGLGLEDVATVSKLMQMLQPFAKKQRARIVGALVKVFA